MIFLFTIRYKRIENNINVIQQSACLVFNPIAIDNYASFFNCTPFGRASDYDGPPAFNWCFSF